MTLRRRADDDNGDDSWRQRDDPMELRLGINGKSIQARGLIVVSLIVMAFAMISVWALDHFQTATMTDQHRSLKLGQDRTSCMVSMSVDDRIKFRNEYRPGAFRQWCPWVDE